MSLNRPRMFGLRVASVRQETPDAVSIAFAVPEALRAAYAFAPGQYLTIEATLAGEAQRRAYSICSTPESGEMRIAVRRIAGGEMSVYLTTAIAAGDQLSVMTPTGRFGALPPPDGPRRIAAFAAGSGITPVIGVIGTLLAREAQTRVWLAYGNRSAETILFREALAALKDRYPDRFALIHVLSREAQDIPLLNGRIDQAKATILLRMMAGPVDHVLICGPAAMIGDVEAAARAQGVAAGAIHAERFVSAHGGAPRRVAPVSAAAGMAVTIIADGKRRVITAAAGEAVLDAALRAGLDLPYACKGGMCSTCRARLVAGTAPMAVNFALEPWEIDAGFVLTCQARPAGEGVIVDYDAV